MEYFVSNCAMNAVACCYLDFECFIQLYFLEGLWIGICELKPVAMSWRVHYREAWGCKLMLAGCWNYIQHNKQDSMPAFRRNSVCLTCWHCIPSKGLGGTKWDGLVCSRCATLTVQCSGHGGSWRTASRRLSSCRTCNTTAPNLNLYYILINKHR